MQLISLSVHNFGVFRGYHTFDFTPVPQQGARHRHLTVIMGHNGAGKSTLFQALALAMHGPLALGERISRRDYNEFLLSHLHHCSDGGSTVVSNEGGISLEFEYVKSGQLLHIRAERCWQRSGLNVLETQRVFQNRELIDLDPSDYQTWLNDLIPPGLAPILFFDAERLDDLANPELHNGALGDTLRRLLGLDLVTQLQSDLIYYTRQRGSVRAVEHLRAKVLQHQAALDAVSTQLAQLESIAEVLITNQEELNVKLAQAEHRLASEGGSYAERRPLLQERLRAVNQEIEDTAAQLRNLSAGLLPFALAPELCRVLSQRLTQEATLRRHQIAAKAWQDRIAQVETALQEQDLWQDLRIPQAAQQALRQRLVALLHEHTGSENPEMLSMVHQLSEPDEEKLQSWISQVLQEIPQQIQKLGQSLQGLKSERKRIERDLGRAPDDAVLAPIHAEILRLETAQGDLQTQQRRLDKEIGALQFQIDEETRHLQRAAEQLAEAQSDVKQLELAERSKLVLRAYEDALVRRRLGMLEDRLVVTFNAICRKEHMLASVHIDPDDFSMELRNVDGHRLGLQDFSAGERQLHALALLWALRQVSGRQLPLMVDTPLARLDEVHRERFLGHYVPSVSNQVLLFVTEAELNNEFAQTEPYLARVYHLSYDPHQEQTLVELDTPAFSLPSGGILGMAVDGKDETNGP